MGGYGPPGRETGGGFCAVVALAVVAVSAAAAFATEARSQPVPNTTREYLSGVHEVCPKGWTRTEAGVCWRWRVIYWTPDPLTIHVDFPWQSMHEDCPSPSERAYARPELVAYCDKLANTRMKP